MWLICLNENILFNCFLLNYNNIIVFLLSLDISISFPLHEPYELHFVVHNLMYFLEQALNKSHRETQVNYQLLIYF